MKLFISILTLMLALSIFATSAVSCGSVETDTETEGSKVTEVVTESEDPRQAVKDDVPAGLNFSNVANNTVTFFVRDDSTLWKNELDVDEITDDTLYDAIYRRNDTVEQRLGVIITTIGQAGNYANHVAWNETLRNAVNTKTGDFDGTAFYMSRGSALATEGMYYNVIDFPNLSLDKPWWNQNIQDEVSLFGTLYFLAGDIAITQTASGFAIFYNKDLFEKYYSSANVDLYQTVRDGAWTIDVLYELVEPVWEDINSSGVMDDGDVAGFNAHTRKDDGGMDSWIAAMGISLTTMKEGVPELSFYSERTVSAFEKVKELHLDNTGTLYSDGFDTTKFINGNLMFTRAMLNAGSELRDATFGYGVLPMPKYDVEQTNYATITENTASLISILASCEDDRKEMVGATLELMAAESYKQVTPAYYETALKSKYANAPEDAEMYDVILGSFTFSFGYCYSSVSLASIGSLFRDLDKDLAQAYTANATQYETALQTLIDKLDTISLNLGAN